VPPYSKLYASFSATTLMAPSVTEMMLCAHVALMKFFLIVIKNMLQWIIKLCCVVVFHTVAYFVFVCNCMCRGGQNVRVFLSTDVTRGATPSSTERR